MMITEKPFGSWESPIEASHLTSSGGDIDGCFEIVGDSLYAIYRMADGKEKQQICEVNLKNLTPVNLSPTLIPKDMRSSLNIRSRLHEYGGKSFTILQDGGILKICVVDFATQNLWLLSDDLPPYLLCDGINKRFADMNFHAPSRQIITIVEQHDNDKGEVHNYLAAVSLNAEFKAIATGADFYAAPSLSPCGKYCAWLEWDHPHMPWDNARLMLGEFDKNGGLRNIKKLAGGNKNGKNTSCFQPEFHPNGDLFFTCDDDDGLWQLHSYNLNNHKITLYPLKNANGLTIEAGLPLWQLGMRCYDIMDDGNIALAGALQGEWGLYILTLSTSYWRQINCGFSSIEGIRSHKNNIYCIATMPNATAQLYRLSALNHDEKPLISAISMNNAKRQNFDGYISTAIKISFPTSGGDMAHGYYYPPCNKDYKPPKDSIPPLIMRCHGGPSGQANKGLQLKIQFWTSRGFAIFDLNYRGSTGFGRNYREKLYGQWGVYDYHDCLYAAQHLINHKLADPDKLGITGGSAGGFTVLSALTFGNIFKAGVSAYGIGDLQALIADTHKFESQYLNQLVGKWPNEKATYIARSPLYHADKISCPILFLQGGEDKVVPPRQMLDMVKAMRAQSIPAGKILFPNEGHGFRESNNIIRAILSELAFYGKTFNINIANIDIDKLLTNVFTE